MNSRTPYIPRDVVFINALRAVLRLEPLDPEPDAPRGRAWDTWPEDDGNRRMDRERNDV